jgi:hypothetical protein
MAQLTLGPTPCNEDCEQVGPNCDYTKMEHECKTFQRMLERIHFQNPDSRPPDGVHFAVQKFPHSFGPYLEVVVCFDDASESHVQFAYMVEETLPDLWDDEARKELANV